MRGRFPGGEANSTNQNTVILVRKNPPSVPSYEFAAIGKFDPTVSLYL